MVIKPFLLLSLVDGGCDQQLSSSSVAACRDVAVRVMMADDAAVQAGGRLYSYLSGSDNDDDDDDEVVVAEGGRRPGDWRAPASPGGRRDDEDAMSSASWVPSRSESESDVDAPLRRVTDGVYSRINDSGSQSPPPPRAHFSFLHLSVIVGFSFMTP